MIGAGASSARRIAALAKRELRELLRDRMHFTLAFIAPPLMMLVIGFGLDFDVEALRLAVIDHDGTPTSRRLVERFANSRAFEIEGSLASEREADDLMMRGAIRAALVIPPRFEADLAGGRSAAVQTLIDGTFPYRAEVASGYASAVIASFDRDERLSRSRGPARAREAPPPIDLEIRWFFNEPLESRWSIGPATLMLVLMIFPPLLTAVGVVREKERGSIDALRASPLARHEFVLGKWLPSFGIATIDFLVLWSIALAFFGAPFRGDAWFFLVASLVYLACTSGLGLVVSLLVRSQIAAILVTLLVALVPTMLYSGMMTPLSSLSEIGRIQSNLLPATYYNRVVEGSFLRGTGAAPLALDLAALAGFAGATFLAATMLFAKRVRR